MESRKRKSAFHSMAHLTHSCFKCSARFPNSGLLVQHMKENHTSFVEHPPSSNMPRPSDITDREDSPYKNSIATCPFCGHECLTRKKLMLHLELEHKDDNESEEGPRVKFIRLDDSRNTQLLEELRQHNHENPSQGPSVSNDSNVVRNLLQAIGPQNSNVASTSIAKTESKPSSNKLQYKCFWCEASFRKRGKLMDHIDTLHKHNKQQNQAEAERIGSDDQLRPLNSRLVPPNVPFSSSGMFRPPSLVGYHHSSIGGGSSTLSSPNQTMIGHPSSLISPAVSQRADMPVTETKNKQSNNNLCSFNLFGSLRPTDKPKSPETRPVDTCKFYFGKKGNPIANARSTPAINPSINLYPGSSTPVNSSRRFSLPNMLEGASNGVATLTNLPYHYRLMSPAMSQASSMAAAVQQSYLFGMRAPMFPQSFYSPRMPMMLPQLPACTTTMQDRSQTDRQTSPQQLLNRMNTLNHSVRSSPRSSGTSHSESPLDLTKSYL